jgi:hypothetical protein
MNRSVAAQIALALSSESDRSTAAQVSPMMLRKWMGRVQEVLLRGVRLRDSMQPQATPQLEKLADELESVVEQIRCALALNGSSTL